MLLANSGGRIALVLVGTSLWVALMRLLLPLLAMSQIGGLLLIFLCLPAFSIDMLFAPLFPSLCGLLAGVTPDRSFSSVSRAFQDAWDVFWDELGTVPTDVVLALLLGMRFPGLV